MKSVNDWRFEPTAVRDVAGTLARRGAVGISVIILSLGVALAGTLLPWAFGQLAVEPAVSAALERLPVGSRGGAASEGQQVMAGVAVRDDSAASEPASVTAGTADRTTDRSTDRAVGQGRYGIRRDGLSTRDLVPGE